MGWLLRCEAVILRHLFLLVVDVETFCSSVWCFSERFTARSVSLWNINHPAERCSGSSCAHPLDLTGPPGLPHSLPSLPLALEREGGPFISSALHHHLHTITEHYGDLCLCLWWSALTHTHTRPSFLVKMSLKSAVKYFFSKELFFIFWLKFTATSFSFFLTLFYNLYIQINSFKRI